MPAIDRIRLIRENRRQIFRRRISLRMNLPESVPVSGQLAEIDLDFCIDRHSFTYGIRAKTTRQKRQSICTSIGTTEVPKTAEIGHTGQCELPSGLTQPHHQHQRFRVNPVAPAIPVSPQQAPIGADSPGQSSIRTQCPNTTQLLVVTSQTRWVRFPRLSPRQRGYRQPAVRSLLLVV